MREGGWLRHPLTRSLGTALAAMLLYGGWALWANRAHGVSAAGWAAATQGFVSATVTFGISAIMEGLARIRGRRLVRALVSALGGMVVAGTYTVAMHWAMGTPELVSTIAPIFVIGSPYCAIYAAVITR